MRYLGDMVMNTDAPSSEAGAELITGRAGTASPEDAVRQRTLTANGA